MTFEANLQRWSKRLAELFPGWVERQRLARAAGIELGLHLMVPGRDSAAWWQEVLSELTEEQLGALLQAAVQERPGEMSLLILRQEYESWLRERRQAYRSAQPPPRPSFEFSMREPEAAAPDEEPSDGKGLTAPPDVGPPAPVSSFPPDVAAPSSTPSAPEVTTLRLDAAVPERVNVGRAFSIAVAVRQLTSPNLSEPDLPVVRSGDAQIEWPAEQGFVRLRIQVSSAHCKIDGDPARSFKLFRGHDSPTFYFSLTPVVTGQIDVRIELYQEEDLIGSARINTTAADQAERLVGEVEVVLQSHVVQAAPLTSGTQLALARALLRCPTVFDRQTRDAIVNDLPEMIRLGISRSDTALLDVRNIISLALNYQGGLAAFIDGVRAFEGDSLPIAEVDRVLAEAGWGPGG
jgi:hypothetical protein